MFTGAGGSGTTPGFNFGGTAGTTVTTQATTGATGIFGTGGGTTTKPGGFTFGGQTQTASAPAGGFNFGNTGTAPATATATPLQGTAAASLQGTAAASLQGTATPLQGTNVPSTGTPGFGFGVQPTVAGTTAVKPIHPTTVPNVTSATGGLNFSLGGAKTVATTVGAPAGGLSYNLTSTANTIGSSSLIGTTTTTTAAKTTAGTGIVGFSMPVSSSTAPATSTAATGIAPTTTTTTTSGLPQAQITYQQLEENINKWMADLEKQEKDFLTQATQVNAWDRLLVENGEKITALNSDMERVKIDQQKLDHELDFIKSQQRELEELLVPLEKSVEQQPNISFQQHADLERENTYQLAENVDAQLKRMVQDLKDIIDHLNTNTNQDNADPIQQITKILNAHMDALQWVDQNTALLGRRVEDVAKQMEVQRKEQERNFRLVYN